MPEADHHRRDTGERDQPRQQVAAPVARRQVKRDQEDRERRRGPPDVDARGGRIEAERGGASRDSVGLSARSAVPSRSRPARTAPGSGIDCTAGISTKTSGTRATAPMRRRRRSTRRPAVNRRRASGDAEQEQQQRRAVDAPDGQRRARPGPRRRSPDPAPLQEPQAMRRERRIAAPSSTGAGLSCHPLHPHLPEGVSGPEDLRPAESRSELTGPSRGPPQKTRSSTTSTSPGRTVTFGRAPLADVCHRKHVHLDLAARPHAGG